MSYKTVELLSFKDVKFPIFTWTKTFVEKFEVLKIC